MNKNSNGFLIGFLAGFLVVGLAAAILLTLLSI